MENIPFFEVMNAHSDKKLKEIVEEKRDSYQPEAIAAAEFVLRKRQVIFKETSDETIEMTVDEIREDVIHRRQRGEDYRSIREDYKSKGIDIDDMEEGNIFSSQSKSFLVWVAVFLSLIVIGWTIYANYKGRGNLPGLIGIVVMCWVAGLILYLRYEIKISKRNR